MQLALLSYSLLGKSLKNTKFLINNTLASFDEIKTKVIV